MNWDVPAYSKDSKVCQLHDKVENGERLSRSEMEWVQQKLIGNSYSNTGVPVGGWMFTFDKALRRILVKQYGEWQEYWAFSKSILRMVLYGRVEKMIYVD